MILPLKLKVEPKTIMINLNTEHATGTRRANHSIIEQFPQTTEKIEVISKIVDWSALQRRIRCKTSHPSYS